MPLLKTQSVDEGLNRPRSFSAVALSSAGDDSPLPQSPRAQIPSWYRGLHMSLRTQSVAELDEDDDDDDDDDNNDDHDTKVHDEIFAKAALKTRSESVDFQVLRQRPTWRPGGGVNIGRPMAIAHRRAPMDGQPISVDVTKLDRNTAAVRQNGFTDKSSTTTSPAVTSSSLTSASRPSPPTVEPCHDKTTKPVELSSIDAQPTGGDNDAVNPTQGNAAQHDVTALSRHLHPGEVLSPVSPPPPALPRSQPPQPRFQSPPLSPPDDNNYCDGTGQIKNKVGHDDKVHVQRVRTTDVRSSTSSVSSTSPSAWSDRDRRHSSTGDSRSDRQSPWSLGRWKSTDEMTADVRSRVGLPSLPPKVTSPLPAATRVPSTAALINNDATDKSQRRQKGFHDTEVTQSKPEVEESSRVADQRSATSSFTSVPRDDAHRCSSSALSTAGVRQQTPPPCVIDQPSTTRKYKWIVPETQTLGRPRQVGSNPSTLRQSTGRFSSTQLVASSRAISSSCSNISQQSSSVSHVQPRTSSALPPSALSFNIDDRSPSLPRRHDNGMLPGMKAALERFRSLEALAAVDGTTADDVLQTGTPRSLAGSREVLNGGRESHRGRPQRMSEVASPHFAQVLTKFKSMEDVAAADGYDVTPRWAPVTGRTPLVSSGPVTPRQIKHASRAPPPAALPRSSIGSTKPSTISFQTEQPSPDISVTTSRRALSVNDVARIDFHDVVDQAVVATSDAIPDAVRWTTADDAEQPTNKEDAVSTVKSVKSTMFIQLSSPTSGSSTIKSSPESAGRCVPSIRVISVRQLRQ